MILGFAHLTRSTGQIDDAIAQMQGTGFELKSLSRFVPSSPAKWPLMAHRATMHDLAMLQGRLALEIIGHDTGSVKVPAALELDGENKSITVRVRDLSTESDFMSQAFRCPSNAGEIEIRGAFPTWSARLRLVEDATAPMLPPLDVEGFSCLAFYSNNPAEDVQRLLALGAHDATDQFGITVNGRDMSIVMLRSPGGTILELVKVNRQ
jgi:hypothetical protein